MHLAFMPTFSYVLLVTFVLLAVCPSTLNGHPSDERCGLVEIRNSPDRIFGPTGASISKQQLLRCVIIDGDFIIAMINGEGVTYNNTDFPVLPRLREITGSILVYAVKGLTTLGHMFPNLRILGGAVTFSNYALLIQKNDDLLEIGLNKLTTIANGGVKITENKNLCYAQHINWKDMMIGDVREVLVEYNQQSKCKDFKCKNKSRCQHFNLDGTTLTRCWNSTTCQRACPYHKLENGSIGPGCAENGKRCHDYCLGGCMVANDKSSCHTCRHAVHNGVCHHRCADGYYKRPDKRCVTRAECDALPPTDVFTYGSAGLNFELVWKSFHKRCEPECPAGYEEDKENSRRCKKCQSYCPKRCRGTILDDIGNAMKYRHCNIIEGNLKLNISNFPGFFGYEDTLVKAFGKVREIKGYLDISFDGTHLGMFKNLRVIHGHNLLDHRYALSVVGNQHLQELFGPDLQIRNGLATFHDNPMLCYDKITEFMQDVGLIQSGTNVSEVDVSLNNNGNRAGCAHTEPVEDYIVS